MFDLLLSPYRRLRTRTRAAVTSTSVDLAGRGLFWPILVMLIAAGAATVYFGWTPLTMFVFHLLEPWWVWIYLSMLVANIVGFAVRHTVQRFLMLEWYIFYGVVGIPTLIWASYPSLGGGVQELSFWIVVFGVVVEGVARAFRLGIAEDEDPPMSIPFIMGGYAVGLVTFTIYHVAVHHPVPGDWWTAPACSALAAVVALMIRAVSRDE